MGCIELELANARRRNDNLIRFGVDRLPNITKGEHTKV
jgi:hypothetical protein